MHSEFAHVIFFFERFNSHLQAYYMANRNTVIFIVLGAAVIVGLVGRYLKYGHIFKESDGVVYDGGSSVVTTVVGTGNCFQNQNQATQSTPYSMAGASAVSQNYNLHVRNVQALLNGSHGMLSGIGSYPTKDDTDYSPLFKTTKTNSTFYHGGPMSGVLDIHNNGRIKLGLSVPKGLWMSPNFEIAYSYASNRSDQYGQGGGVIELLIEDDVEITNLGSAYFVLEIPEGIESEYWTFDSGIYTVAVYDMQRKIIA